MRFLMYNLGHMKQLPKIVILGPQGSGKGTQADLLARRFRIPHISAGDLLRQERATHSRLGKKIATIIDHGNMVPDAIMSQIIRQRMQRPDAKRGWILDGYPRFVTQYRTFNTFAKPNIAILLKLPGQMVTKRLADRRSCANGHIYHLRHQPPRRRGFCDRDGLPLQPREDDTPKAIKNRLHLYHRQTEPIMDIYRRQGILITIDAKPKISVVDRSISQQLKKLPWLS